jgi:chromosome partitioning protein
MSDIDTGRRPTRPPYSGAVHVVSVMNYKGGVGKTTLTANLAAEIANGGYRVLMIDLDPQTNLTFSFYSVDEWNAELRAGRTIKRWYDGDLPGQDVALGELVLTPEKANTIVKENAGQLDLIASHLALIDIDLKLGAQLAGAVTLSEAKRKFLRVHGCLREALRAEPFRDYDIILIDCPPNFGLVTKTAIVASDHILVPAKADYLSTLGIGYLQASLDKLVREYNEYAEHDSGGDSPAERIDPRFAGIAFTMTQIHAGQPIIAQRMQIEEVGAAIAAPVFRSSIRNSPRYFADAGRDGVPAVLTMPLDDVVSRELRALSAEFVAALAGGGDRS